MDGTLGHGGHTMMLLEASAPTGRVIGIDRDARNIATARERIGETDRLSFVQDDYRHLKRILDAQGIERVDGILLDVGFSSAHVDDAARGFSFQQEGPLDMRYDTDQGQTAAEVVNTWSEEQLTHVFLIYGEEDRAREVAKAILARRRERPFSTTVDLAETIAVALGRHGKIHPATRVFQALRIVVNDELGAIETVLPQAVDALNVGGRLCVVSFHSLEDRLVKRFLKARPDVQILTKRPLTPSPLEIAGNPRSRSAKLRVAQKLGPDEIGKSKNKYNTHDRSLNNKALNALPTDHSNVPHSVEPHA